MCAVGDRRVERPGWRDDVRVVGWWLALGAGVGGMSGLVFGGLGGRLLMFALRTRSPQVSGVISDDGFEIGRVSIDTLNLLAFGTAAGAVAGGLYVAMRPALPPVLRIPLAALVAGTVGGVAFIKPEGVDLNVLDARGLAVLGFTALPALCAATTAVFVERWAEIEPWSVDRRRIAAFAPVVLGVFILPVLLLGAAAALLARRIRFPDGVLRTLRIAVPALIMAVIAQQALTLAREVERVL